MHETKVMAAVTSLSLLSNKRERVVAFEEKHCDASVATARGEARILDELGLMHVAGDAGRLRLKELHIVLQLGCHGIAHDAMGEVNE